MRVVTYNIRGGLAMDNRRSLRRVAEVIRALKPDVVCLQEVHKRLMWSRLQDQPAQLSRHLGMEALFQANYRVGFGEFGNAILTRLPVRNWESVPLPNPREQVSILRRLEGRGMLVAEMESPQGPITVMCTHWSLDAMDRLEAAEIITNRCAGARGPVILMADLNSGPESPEFTRLRDNSGLIDADETQNRPTYPADIPSARIDYILTSPAVSVRNLEVVQALASDHRPIVAELEISAA